MASLDALIEILRTNHLLLGQQLAELDVLARETGECHQLIRELLKTLAQQTHLNDKLQHQLEQLLRRVYGRKSEKLDPNQLLLFAREILAASETAPPPAK